MPTASTQCEKSRTCRVARETKSLGRPLPCGNSVFPSLRRPHVSLRNKVSVHAVEDAAALAPSAPAPDDPLISIMFSLAIVALSVLTLGVGYLSLTSWLDSRQEEEDRRKSGFAPKKVEGTQGLSAFETSSVDKLSKKSKKKKSGAPKKASGKGFGS